MKKYIAFILTAVMALGCLTACGNGNGTAGNSSEAASDNAAESEGKKLKIVTTIFPEYDWVKQILGDHADEAEITMLLDNGVDLHSYQPTAEDIMKISNCDLFIYVGGESDEWVEGALSEAVNKEMKVINLLDVLGDSVKEEEVVEGMEAEEHEHEDGETQDGEEHEHEDGEAEEEGPEYDEHVWLSVKNAETLCDAIADALAEIDMEHAEDYQANAAAYHEKLAALDADYDAAVKEPGQKTVLFGDRFPFRYLVDDYGLSYYAAFVGCSAETEASFETITFLAGKVDELGLHSVLTIEKSDQKIAKTIIENTKEKNQQILTMDSMQSTTSGDVSGGADYLSIMENNLEVLKEALQ